MSKRNSEMCPHLLHMCVIFSLFAPVIDQVRFSFPNIFPFLVYYFKLWLWFLHFGLNTLNHNIAIPTADRSPFALSKRLLPSSKSPCPTLIADFASRSFLSVSLSYCSNVCLLFPIDVKFSSTRFFSWFSFFFSSAHFLVFSSTSLCCCTISL